jgi:hypothetical protein
VSKIDINDIVVDPNYKNEEIEKRIEKERQKYFDKHGRWLEEDSISIDVLI